jgi:hypothetical protein
VTDAANKTTHAQRRREEAREGSRLKLRAGQYVRRLREIADKAESAEAATIPALRLKAEIYWKLLGKCLPDLKAVEHNGTVNHVNYDAAILGLLNERSAQAGDAVGASATVQ